MGLPSHLLSQKYLGWERGCFGQLLSAERQALNLRWLSGFQARPHWQIAALARS